MAEMITIELVDDIDGSPATETVKFSLDGTHFEVDLNEKHAAAFRASIEKVKAYSRRTGGRQKARGAKVAKTDTVAIRGWANANGYEVSARGRVPLAILAEYKKANK
jgi:hypothetical protein